VIIPHENNVILFPEAGHSMLESLRLSLSVSIRPLMGSKVVYIWNQRLEMTIEIHKPELEALLLDRIAGGADVEDLLISALKSAGGVVPESPKLRRNLVDILSEPPFAGSDLDLERQKDYPRRIDL
jgi:hypothetical protein